MLDTFLLTLSPMLVMFLCMLIGFVLNKANLAPKNTGAVLSRLETHILMPALIINTFTTYCTPASIADQAPSILFCILGIAITVALAFPLARCFYKDGYEKKLYQYALLSANFGFLGNAIVPQILGQEALYPYMLFTLLLNLMCYGWWANILIPSGNSKHSFLRNLLNPTFMALILGAVLGLLGVRQYLPDFLTDTIANLSACMGPLAMILTGFIIGNYDLKALLKNKKVYLASVLRLIVIPALVIGIFYLLGANKQVLVMSLFAFGTPLGLNTVIIPTSYGSDAHTGASMTMISHVACILTIPLMYAILLAIL